jgi:ketosteroid isomerase-like protein
MRSINYIITAMLLISMAAISYTDKKNTRANELTEDDKAVITGMIKQYNEAWLKDDSATIMNLFADTATLIPNGMEPIHGKKDITGFWWPNDSSKTTIDNYKINVLEVNGSGNWAYTFEEGKLEWSYEKGTDKFSRKQKSYEVTIFNKSSNVWKITRRIWTDQLLK